MGLLTSILNGTPLGATYTPVDDFWYTANPRGTATEAGYPVSADGALRLAAVNACVRLIAGMVSTLPLVLYRRLDNEGKERATTNPLYRLLHNQPNGWQTSKDWRRWGMECLLLRGNWYNEIIYDGRFAISELRPLHPDRVTVTLLDSGRRGYVYRPPRGPQRTLTQDEIFHVTAPLSLDGGVTGSGVIEFARETLGAAHAAKGFAARFWRQGAEGNIVYSTPNTLSETTRANNEKALQSRMGGWQNAHKVLLMDGGLKPERLTVTQKDTQYLETQKFSVEETCMFFGTSPDMIGHNDGTSQWGTGIESRKQGFIDFCLTDWLVSIEQTCDRDLVLDERHFAKFNVDAFLRGDTTARATSHRQYVDGGIKSVNEVRILEDLNPLPGEEFDKPHRAGNIGGNPGGGNPDTTRKPPTPTAPAAEANDARAHSIVLVAAARTVRKETAALRKQAERGALEAEWVTQFYGRHVDVLIEALQLDTETARRYGFEHCGEVLKHGVTVLDAWEREAPTQLAVLALGHALPALPAPPPAPVHNITVQSPHFTIADGALRVENHPPMIQAPIVNVQAPPPAMIHHETHFDAGAIPVNVTVEPPPPAEITVNHETRIEPGAIHVDAPITVESPDIIVPSAPPPPVNVDARTVIEKGAVNVAPPAVMIEAPPPAQVTISEGAVHVQNNITTPELVLPPPSPPVEVEKVVKRDKDGRIISVTEKPKRGR